MELQKNDIIDITIDDLGMDGEGVGRADGKAVFVRGALPGERVRAKIIAVKPRFDVGLLVRVLVPSPDRTSPVCPLFGKCGGCDLQHVRYSAQLEAKRALVAGELKKAGVAASVDETVPSPEQYRYRNKLSLPVRRGAADSAEPEVGFFARGSHRVVPAADCPIQREFLAPLVTALKRFMREEKLVGYDEERRRGGVRELTAREIGGKLVVTLVVTSENLRAERFLGMLEPLFPRVELWLNVNTGTGNAIYGPRWLRVGGDASPATEEGLSLDLHPAAFFQVNDGVRRLIFSRLASLLTGGVAIEAYSGAGILSASLAKKASAVYAIEINREAHEAAMKLKRDNNIPNFFPVLGDVADRLPEVLEKIKNSPIFAPHPPLSPPQDKNSEENSSHERDAQKNIANNEVPPLNNAEEGCINNAENSDLNNNKEIFLIVDPPRAGLSESVRETLRSAAGKFIEEKSLPKSPASSEISENITTSNSLASSAHLAESGTSQSHTSPDHPAESYPPQSHTSPDHLAESSTPQSHTPPENSEKIAIKLIYISCNPATLARDLRDLTGGENPAYTITTVTPYDMFPQTSNVETLVVLSHKKPDGHIGVKVEFGEEEGQISLKEAEKRAEERKPKEKVTYKMIQEYIEKTYGFKVHTAYIAEVKRDLGLPMYDAPNAVEELKRPRSHPSPQMVEAIKETLKHFEII